MNIRLTPAETSIEFAIDNARDRLLLLKGKDYEAILSEYKEWLLFSHVDDEVLVIEDNKCI
tara:strand:- start:22980 stop:23162 length:183 start_codon:yes stop_codon:yes gene_type:complete